ncbi:Max-binding protein MNT [Merluccius polli]|uniref:Max-binding protein MNT n=1 Tax=Merluccius polli TaxID=89951 RepID=A0AA47M0A2_MERPO|nr:Max-binding protein MNT [Merluccius polli]
MERLAREKIATQQRLAELKNELSLSMDAAEMERVLRQTVQPEDDQLSTSTASEGEEDLDQDIDDEDISAPSPTKTLPKAPPPIIQARPLLALQPATLPLSGVLTTPSMGGGLTVQSNAPPPQAIAPAPQAIAPHPLPLQPSAVQVQPTVIAHAAVSHPSVIQAVHHAPPAHHKHLTHIAPSPGPASTVLQPLAAAPAGAAQPIGHITVHPVAHLGPAHLPTLYPQAVTVSQPTVVGHITHTFTHHHHHALANAHAAANGVQVNGAAVGSPVPTSLGKQLVSQTTVLNPVTLVNVPTGTFKLT